MRLKLGSSPLYFYHPVTRLMIGWIDLSSTKGYNNDIGGAVGYNIYDKEIEFSI